MAENITLLGADSRHVRFNAVGPDGIAVPCILFRRADEFIKMLTSNSIIDVAGELGVNEFNGRSRLQMVVKDIRRSRS